MNSKAGSLFFVSPNLNPERKNRHRLVANTAPRGTRRKMTTALYSFPHFSRQQQLFLILAANPNYVATGLRRQKQIAQENGGAGVFKSAEMLAAPATSEKSGRGSSHNNLNADHHVRDLVDLELGGTSSESTLLENAATTTSAELGKPRSTHFRQARHDQVGSGVTPDSATKISGGVNVMSKDVSIGRTSAATLAKSAVAAAAAEVSSSSMLSFRDIHIGSDSSWVTNNSYKDGDDDCVDWPVTGVGGDPPLRLDSIGPGSLVGPIPEDGSKVCLWRTKEKDLEPKHLKATRICKNGKKEDPVDVKSPAQIKNRQLFDGDGNQLFTSKCGAENPKAANGAEHAEQKKEHRKKQHAHEGGDGKHSSSTQAPETAPASPPAAGPETAQGHAHRDAQKPPKSSSKVHTSNAPRPSVSPKHKAPTPTAPASPAAAAPETAQGHARRDAPKPPENSAKVHTSNAPTPSVSPEHKAPTSSSDKVPTPSSDSETQNSTGNAKQKEKRHANAGKTKKEKEKNAPAPAPCCSDGSVC